jgi:hypothetical protein
MNAFCRWLHEEGVIPTLVKLAPMRLEKRIIRTHEAAALKALLSYKPKTFNVKVVSSPAVAVQNSTESGGGES